MVLKSKLNTPFSPNSIIGFLEIEAAFDQYTEVGGLVFDPALTLSIGLVPTEKTGHLKLDEPASRVLSLSLSRRF
jgi:hypothetical protein|uniref:Uncharacterized protein n=1 Tax=Picea glauca TaxID=3330 RepID=A0A117NHK0_PICGL|nr:hypothetical protein ABT39_MTgene4518 [Picea glauca]QHR86690.1 hypothetical protein Q903MT_gene694 [Picea sitchensis]